MVFAAAASACRFYWDNLPTDTALTVGKSALYTFSLVVMLNKAGQKEIDLSPPLRAAGLAASASCVHALITPFFNYIFGDNEIVFYREWIKRIVTSSIVLCTAQYATTSKVNLVVEDLFKLYALTIAQSFLKWNLDLFDSMFPGPPNISSYCSSLYALPGSNSTYIYGLSSF